MIRIFVSHSWADKVKPQFGQLYQELEKFELLIDKTSLLPGQNIDKHIRQAITDADVVLVLWSQNAAGSEHVQKEIETAIRLGKTVLPCITDDYPIQYSEHLKELLYIDLRETAESKYPYLGWMKVNHFLLNIAIGKLTESVSQNESVQAKEGAKSLESAVQTQGKLAVLISFLEDSFHRRNLQAPTRNQSNPYILNMVRNLLTFVHDKQVVGFLQFVEEVLAKYPNDDDTSVKEREREILEQIRKLDPKRENEMLLLVEQAISSKFKQPMPEFMIAEGFASSVFSSQATDTPFPNHNMIDLPLQTNTISDGEPVNNELKIASANDLIVVKEINQAGTEEKIQSDAKVTSQLAKMNEMVVTLSAQFESKLKYDKHKDEIIDKLHAENQAFKNDLYKKILSPVINELIFIIDDYSVLFMKYADTNIEELNVSKLLKQFGGITEDLENVLYKSGIEVYCSDGNRLDPAKQKVIKTIPTDDPAKDKTVCERLKKGYILEGKMIRQEHVSCYRFEKEMSNP